MEAKKGGQPILRVTHCLYPMQIPMKLNEDIMNSE